MTGGKKAQRVKGNAKVNVLYSYLLCRFSNRLRTFYLNTEAKVSIFGNGYEFFYLILKSTTDLM